MKTDLFDYDLPNELIAEHPAEPRDSARLLVMDRESGRLQHSVFRDLPDYIGPGDVLVLNDTKVMRARLYGQKTDTGGKAELFLVERRSLDTWECLARPGRRLLPGARITFGDGRMTAEVLERLPDGGRLVRFSWKDLTFEQTLDQLGEMPLPPYIKKQPDDPERYQTVYARAEGAKAAPTAGLHFTPELLDQLKGKGVEIVTVTLHVGLGTFRPVQTEDIEDHKMHAEFCMIPPQTAATINTARQRGGRVFAAGTTVARTLETRATDEGLVQAGEGWTSIFIYPGFEFRVVDALITNFHLPRSTLLMMVSAFSDRRNVMEAYAQAIQDRYRFFSFGDAMLIL